MVWNNDWVKGKDYPVWGNTEVYKKTIIGGYLLSNETPRDAYMRVATTVAKRLYKPELAEKFFDCIVGKDCDSFGKYVLVFVGVEKGIRICNYVEFFF